jgi:hypothetical protein
VAEPLEELYGAPLDEFVARRDALARALGKEGRRDEAEEVKGLRKPSVAAWAVNTLARRERPRVDELLEAGERLRKAHAKLLAGGDPAAVQHAAAEERAAVERLVAAAGGVLADAGRPATEATLDRIRDTLHAAASDERVRELVRHGRVVADEEATGFALAGLSPGKAARRPARRERPDPAPAKRKAAEEQVAKARAELAEAEQAVTDAERALARAEKEVDRRRAAVERAERKLERL